MDQVLCHVLLHKDCPAFIEPVLPTGIHPEHRSSHTATFLGSNWVNKIHQNISLRNSQRTSKPQILSFSCAALGYLKNNLLHPSFDTCEKEESGKNARER